MRTLMAAVLIAAACSSMPSGEDEVTLRVEPTTVQRGDSVVLTLHNGDVRQLGYNLCASAMERSTAGEWEAVPSERMCTMELRSLEPGGDATYTIAIPRDLAAGEYRFTTGVNWMQDNAHTAVASNTIRVTQ